MNDFSSIFFCTSPVKNWNFAGIVESKGNATDFTAGCAREFSVKHISWHIISSFSADFWIEGGSLKKNFSDQKGLVHPCLLPTSLPKLSKMSQHYKICKQFSQSAFPWQLTEEDEGEGGQDTASNYHDSGTYNIK